MHICSHTTVPGPLVKGNRHADILTEVTIIPNTFEQARLSHAFYHQNAKALQKTFHLTMDQARQIVTACPDCQLMAPSLSYGVNPRGLQALGAMTIRCYSHSWIWKVKIEDLAGFLHTVSDPSLINNDKAAIRQTTPPHKLTKPKWDKVIAVFMGGETDVNCLGIRLSEAGTSMCALCKRYNGYIVAKCAYCGRHIISSNGNHRVYLERNLEPLCIRCGRYTPLHLLPWV